MQSYLLLVALMGLIELEICVSLPSIPIIISQPTQLTTLYRPREKIYIYFRFHSRLKVR